MARGYPSGAMVTLARRIQVSCYCGYKADQEPRWFVLDGRRLEVLGIADRWMDPQSTTFKVRGSDGHRYLIRHDRPTDTWWLLAVFPAHG